MGLKEARALKMLSYLVGIVGGSGAGKTTFAERLLAESRGLDGCIISLDNYYRGLNGDADPESYNFDHPKAVDLDGLCDDLDCLKNGKIAQIPAYDFKTHRRKKERICVEPVEFIVLEGLFLFISPRLRELFDLRIFLDVATPIRLARRIARDVRDRGRLCDEVVRRFWEQCEPAYVRYVAPTAKHANLLIKTADGFGDEYDGQVLTAWLKVREGRSAAFKTRET